MAVSSSLAEGQWIQNSFTQCKNCLVFKRCSLDKLVGSADALCDWNSDLVVASLVVHIFLRNKFYFISSHSCLAVF